MENEGAFIVERDGQCRVTEKGAEITGYRFRSYGNPLYPCIYVGPEHHLECDIKAQIHIRFAPPETA